MEGYDEKEQEEETEIARVLDGEGIVFMHNLLGTTVQAVDELSADAWRLLLADGRFVVLKTVPRQETGDWQPGMPWTELVALDFLADEGLNVPKLLVVDIDQGRLVREYIEGSPLDTLQGKPALPIYRELVHQLDAVDQRLEAHRHVLTGLRCWPLQPGSDPLRWARMVAALVSPQVRNAWFTLAQEARQGILQLGPLDVQAANALWDQERIWLLDWATVGQDYRERRVVAYAQVAGRRPSTLLDADAYDGHAKRYGTASARHLAFWDFAFWGVALLRLQGAAGRMDYPAGGGLGFEPESQRAYVAMWRRFRIDDPLISAVQSGLVP